MSALGGADVLRYSSTESLKAMRSSATDSPWKVTTSRMPTTSPGLARTVLERRLT